MNRHGWRCSGETGIIQFHRKGKKSLTLKGSVHLFIKTSSLDFFSSLHTLN